MDFYDSYINFIAIQCLYIPHQYFPGDTNCHNNCGESIVNYIKSCPFSSPFFKKTLLLQTFEEKVVKVLWPSG